MPGVWTTRGFEAFRQGSFGDAGKNLYVSRAGVLQRIHCFDLNGDGYVDLPFCNSQEHWETPPAYVYRDRFAAIRYPEKRGMLWPRPTRWSCPPRARAAGSWQTSTGTAMMTWCWACITTAPGRISTPASTTVRRKGWPRRGDNSCLRPHALRSRPAISTAMGGSTWRSCARARCASSIKPSRPSSPRGSSIWRSRAKTWRRTIWMATDTLTWSCARRTGR